MHMPKFAVVALIVLASIGGAAQLRVAAAADGAAVLSGALPRGATGTVCGGPEGSGWGDGGAGI